MWPRATSRSDVSEGQQVLAAGPRVAQGAPFDVFTGEELFFPIVSPRSNLAQTQVMGRTNNEGVC